MARRVTFKFKWVDAEGRDIGVFSKRGSFDGEWLVLDDSEVPGDSILQAARRMDRLV